MEPGHSELWPFRIELDCIQRQRFRGSVSAINVQSDNSLDAIGSSGGHV